MSGARFIVCSGCERTHRVNLDGKVRRHRSRVNSGPCQGSGTLGDGHRTSPIPMTGLVSSIVPEPRVKVTGPDGDNPITDEQIGQLRADGYISDADVSATTGWDLRTRLVLYPHERAMERDRCAEIWNARHGGAA